jgi:hypothetical protein
MYFRFIKHIIYVCLFTYFRRCGSTRLACHCRRQFRQCSLGMVVRRRRNRHHPSTATSCSRLWTMLYWQCARRTSTTEPVWCSFSTWVHIVFLSHSGKDDLGRNSTASINCGFYLCAQTTDSRSGKLLCLFFREANVKIQHFLLSTVGNKSLSHLLSWITPTTSYIGNLLINLRHFVKHAKIFAPNII